MGTRASFWLGDPRDLEHREWLGCVAWDGYHWEDDAGWASCTTEQEFRGAVGFVKRHSADFADPARGGWPFPWTDDIFLTDRTYAFFDGAVRWTAFYAPFVRIGEKISDDQGDDPSMHNVPGPTKEWDRSQPDSIMIFSVGG